MTLLEWRLLFDFALVVLIWIVQLIIYPGFRYIDPNQLKIWHPKYMIRFTIIVGPLMLIQTILVLQMAFNSWDYYTISSLILTIYLWISTSFQFVPIHLKMIKSNHGNVDFNSLQNLNWLRTIAWSTLLFLTILQMISD